MSSKNVSVTVWGPRACFTRPELRTERVSYPVITFPAAVGILEAILWKPEITWMIDSIDIHKLGSTASLVRNELKQLHISSNSAPVNVDLSTNRDQRTTLYLSDVSYTINAHPVLTSFANTKDNSITKYIEMFDRRVAKGQMFSAPFFGVREFSCFFSPAEKISETTSASFDLGMMHSGWDYKYSPPQPKFDRFHVKNGRMLRGVID